jgi:hypothetical protein
MCGAFVTQQDPARPLSPEAQRGERRREMCELLDEARRNAGLTTEALAADIGCTRTAVQKMLDSDDISHPVHADALLSPLVARHSIRLAAARNGMLAIDVPRCAEGSAMLSAISEISRETSDVVTATVEAIADGVVTRPERDALRKQIREAQEALARLDRALELVGDEAATNVHAIGAKR